MNKIYTKDMKYLTKFDTLTLSNSVKNVIKRLDQF